MKRRPFLFFSGENSAGAGAERTRGERARTHTETRAERRRNGAERIAAVGAMIHVGTGTGEMRAHPVAAGFTLRIDTLHSPAGQILHDVSPSGCLLERIEHPWQPKHGVNGAAQTLAMARILPCKTCCVKKKRYKI